MGKLRIGICDDEKIIIHILKNMVLACLEKMQMEGQIEIFESGEKLIERVFELDLIFLDIEMPELDGIETGRIIQQKNNNCKIIMSTSHVERFKEAFKISAFRFITKPFQINELEEVMEAVQAARFGTNIIELYNKRTLFSIEQKEIKYIATYDSYAEFIVKSMVLRKNIALRELENILDKRIFYRIHRKIIVNMLWIQKYQNGIVVINNEEIAVARRKKTEFEQAYIQFDITYR